MFKRQIGPTQYKQKTESVLIRTETPVVGPESNLDYPKMEVEAGVEVSGTLTYAGQEVSGSFKAAGKGKFGIRFVVRRKTTPEIWQDITYQQEVKVMGQMLGWASFDAFWSNDPLILLEGCIDWMEPDEIGAWKEVSRSQEYKKDRVEVEVVSQSLYDPPVTASVGNVLVLSEASLDPVVQAFDGQPLTVAIGSHETKTTVRSHRLLVDGVLLSAPVSVGLAPLQQGDHVFTVEARTDLGVFSFQLPARVEPRLTLEVVAAPRTLRFDARSAVRVALENRTASTLSVRLDASSSGQGWTLTPPVNPLIVDAGQRLEADIEVHAYPANDSSMAATLKVSAVADVRTRAEVSLDMVAFFPISAVRDLERQIVSNATAKGGTVKNYIFH